MSATSAQPLPPHGALPAGVPVAGESHRPPAADAASFLRRVRQGVQGWVAAAVEAATNDLGSSAQVNAVVGGREHTAPALAALRHQGAELARRITQAVQAQLDAAAPHPGAQAGTPAAPAAPAAGGLVLQLIDEAQVDEEIETARIVTLIESEADAELQQLNALCSGMRRLGHVDPKAAPLQPALCARGLRQALADWPEPAPTRLLLLRVLGTAIGRQMRAVYAEQERLLASWGVQPASYRVRQAVPARVAHGPGPQADDERLQADAGAAMQRLTQWARTTNPPQSPPAADGPGLNLRLLGEPVRPGALGAGALPPAASQQLMARLFEQLSSQLAGAANAGPVLHSLQQAGQRLAETDPRLWDDPAHPWWQLVDSLLAAHALQEALPVQHQQALGDSLQRVVQRLDHPLPETPGAVPETMAETAEAVRDLSSRFVEEQASDWVEPVRELQQQADREALEPALRQQIVQQLRSTPVPATLRQFLLGPWVTAMAQVAARRGQDSPELAEMAFTVDDLIRATTQPGVRVSRAQRTVLLRQVQSGLVQAGLPDSRVEAERSELEALLGRPAEAPAATAPAPEEPEAADARDAASDGPGEALAEHLALPSMPLDLHAALPTVPLDMGADGAAAPQHSPEAWAATLRPTGFCRLFLQGRWMTAQLLWISEAGNLFLFKSRHGGRSHSLTRRMLVKLRAAGLATAIEDGHLVAQALDSLVSREIGAA